MAGPRPLTHRGTIRPPDPLVEHPRRRARPRPGDVQRQSTNTRTAPRWQRHARACAERSCVCRKAVRVPKGRAERNAVRLIELLESMRLSRGPSSSKDDSGEWDPTFKPARIPSSSLRWLAPTMLFAISGLMVLSIPLGMAADQRSDDAVRARSTTTTGRVLGINHTSKDTIGLVEYTAEQGKRCPVAQVASNRHRRQSAQHAINAGPCSGQPLSASPRLAASSASRWPSACAYTRSVVDASACPDRPATVARS